MICEKCGMQNVEGSKFCVKCGNSLGSGQPINSVQENYVNTRESMNITSDSACDLEPGANRIVMNSTRGGKLSIASYFPLLFNVVLKPFNVFENELSKFQDLKNSLVLSVLISFLAMLVTLFKSMFYAVRVTTIWSKEVKWVWENLKHLDYVQMIIQNFLVYFGIVMGIAIVYFLASLIVKKETNFPRLLGCASLAVVPAFTSFLILSPLLSLVYAPLGVIVTILGSVSTMILLYEMMSREVLLDGNQKYYFHLACWSILLFSLYYVLMNILMKSVTSGLGNIFNLY